MGFLSKIGNVVKTLVTNPVGSFKEGAKAVSAVTANPVTTIKQGLTAGEQKVAQQGAVVSSVKSLANIGAAAALVVGGGAALGSTTAKSIIKKAVPVVGSIVKGAIPKSTGGKIAAAAIAPVVATAVIKNPSGAVETVGKVAEAQIDLGSVVSNPSRLAAEQYIKEHPGATVALGAGALGLAGVGLGSLANTIATFENTQALQSLPKAEVVTGDLPLSTPQQEYKSQPPAATSSQIIESGPTTPQTQVIKKSSSKKRRKTKKSSSTPSISQRVNVIVSNRSVGTRNNTFLNRRIYA